MHREKKVILGAYKTSEIVLTFTPSESAPSGQFWGIYALIRGVRIVKSCTLNFIFKSSTAITHSCGAVKAMACISMVDHWLITLQVMMPAMCRIFKLTFPI